MVFSFQGLSVAGRQRPGGVGAPVTRRGNGQHGTEAKPQEWSGRTVDRAARPAMISANELTSMEERQSAKDIEDGRT